MLLENPNLTNEELGKKLIDRTVGAIGAVRSFIHNFHMGGDISGLSKLMIHRLEKGSWVCPNCRKTY